MKHDTAFCFSTKDRVEYSKQTLPAVLTDADKFDLHIVDGSTTEAGIQYVLGLAEHEKIKDVHCNIRGGADVAIVYALSMMLDAGYEYLGLIENDVMLEVGWFDRIKDLIGGALVGSVSARCYSDRILVPFNEHAIMANIGAGMVLFSRRGAEAVLDYYRTGSLTEYRLWPKIYTKKEGPVPHEAPDPKQQYQLTADWFYESSMLSRGLVALACTPSMARCLDLPDEAVQTEKTHTTAGELVLVGEQNAPIGNYDFSVNGFSAQPHQFFDFFDGEWKLVWTKHNGPFGMRSADVKTNVAPCSLSIPFFGKQMALLLDASKGTEIEVYENEIMIGKITDTGMGWRSFQFGESKSRTLRLVFAKTSVVVMTAVFDAPQHWFKKGYKLRYKDLQKFL